MLHLSMRGVDRWLNETKSCNVPSWSTGMRERGAVVTWSSPPCLFLFILLSLWNLCLNNGPIHDFDVLHVYMRRIVRNSGVNTWRVIIDSSEVRDWGVTEYVEEPPHAFLGLTLERSTGTMFTDLLWCEHPSATAVSTFTKMGQVSH